MIYLILIYGVSVVGLIISVVYEEVNAYRNKSKYKIILSEVLVGLIVILIPLVNTIVGCYILGLAASKVVLFEKENKK